MADAGQRVAYSARCSLGTPRPGPHAGPRSPLRGVRCRQARVWILRRRRLCDPGGQTCSAGRTPSLDRHSGRARWRRHMISRRLRPSLTTERQPIWPIDRLLYSFALGHAELCTVPASSVGTGISSHGPRITIRVTRVYHPPPATRPSARSRPSLPSLSVIRAPRHPGLEPRPGAAAAPRTGFASVRRHDHVVLYPPPIRAGPGHCQVVRLETPGLDGST